MKYIVITGERMYGPFATATAASRWAIKKLVAGSAWRITPLSPPS